MYPPRSNSDLRNLYSQIVSSAFPSHQKQALIYYILRDCRNASDVATQFARRCYLPEKYKLFIDGLWHLDRLEFRVRALLFYQSSVSNLSRIQRALEYLTEPSLIPTFPDEILYVLTLQHLPKRDDSLALSYYHTVSPPLASEKVQQALFEVLCRASITEAFYFARKNDDRNRRKYLEQLVLFVHKTGAGQDRGNRAMELVNLPLDEQEEEWFENCLLHGAAKTLHGAKDTVLMRRLATGKLSNLSAEVESLGGKKVDGLNWDDLKESMSKHTQLMTAPGSSVQLP